jgi:hypothetical protein
VLSRMARLFIFRVYRRQTKVALEGVAA